MQTKKQFLQFFKHIEKQIDPNDKPALRQAWNDSVDMYIRDKALPERAANWSHPARFYTDSERALWPSSDRPPRKPKLKKGDVIQINGRRWFDRVNGNTYHSVEVLINGVHMHRNPFEYGYDRQFEYTALKWLQTNYKMPNSWTDLTPLWRLRDFGVIVNSFVADVQRKKDL